MSKTNEHPVFNFGGPVGAVGMMVFLPLVTYYLFFAVRFNGGDLLPGPHADWVGFLRDIQPTWGAAALYLVWFAFQAVLQQFAPGRVVEGPELPDGGRLKYKMNGLFSIVLTLVTLGGAAALGLYDPGVFYLQFGPLITVTLIFSTLLSVFVYFHGKKTDPAPHISGRPIQDFFLGSGHNPRVPPRTGFDLKVFCEIRPGLILWAVLNASFAWVQYQKYGYVSTAMILVNLLQFIYVFDCFWNESALLTTMDIKHEGFGWMLAFGDLCWVPFTYSLQAHYLIDHVHELPVWMAILAPVLAITGYLIFRLTNLQKDRFRTDPDNAVIWGKKAEYLQTRRGSKLLLSGFWGLARHFNYIGDELMALSWSLPCMFGSALPYFYPVYFAGLLIHRERRDHLLCSEKYGEDWDEYCRHVRWRIVPGVY